MTDMKALFFLLVIVGSTWACSARELGIELNYPHSEHLVRAKAEVGGDQNLCELCEQYSSEALSYLNDNRTQVEIVNVLHKTCSRLGAFNDECITLVDYYTTLLFSEVASIQPSHLCKKLKLCKQIIISQKVDQDACELCHQTVAEVLLKLKDPDTQVEVIEALLKACESMQHNVKKCKKMVFEYGPIILANAEHFLESNDLCVAIHACKLASCEGKKGTLLDV